MLRTPPLLETPRFAPQFEAEESELCEGEQSWFRGAQPPSRLRSQCPLLPGCGGAAADKVPFHWEGLVKTGPGKTQFAPPPREPFVRRGGLDSTVLILLPMPVPYWSAFAHPGGLPGSRVGLLRHSRGGLVRFLPVM